MQGNHNQKDNTSGTPTKAFVTVCYTAWQLLLRTIVKSCSVARAAWRAFIYFWDIPVLGPTDSYHWY
jgi:hypothetical protein